MQKQFLQNAVFAKLEDSSMANSQKSIIVEKTPGLPDTKCPRARSTKDDQKEKKEEKGNHYRQIRARMFEEEGKNRLENYCVRKKKKEGLIWIHLDSSKIRARQI